MIFTTVAILVPEQREAFSDVPIDLQEFGCIHGSALPNVFTDTRHALRN